MIHFLINNHTNPSSNEIKSGADPGFPVGGGADPLGGANIRFCQIFPKTAWNQENFGPWGGRAPGRPPWIRHCKCTAKNEVRKLKIDNCLQKSFIPVVLKNYCVLFTIAIADIAKNECSTVFFCFFFALLTLTLSLRVQCTRPLNTKLHHRDDIMRKWQFLLGHHKGNARTFCTRCIKKYSYLILITKNLRGWDHT